MSEVSSGAAAYQPWARRLRLAAPRPQGVAKGVDGLDAKGFLHNDRIRAAAGDETDYKVGQAPSMASTMAKSV
jgi:hypothetical protein